MRRAGEQLRHRCALQQPRRDEPARLRTRGIPILRLPAAACRRRTASALYPHLAAIANAWNAALGVELRFPTEHDDYLEVAVAPGRPGRRRCCCNMSRATTTACIRICTASTSFRCRWPSFSREPGRDFTGGEFVLTEQRPRMQSRAEVVPLTQGAGVIFPVHHRPVRGTRGVYRVNLRHGVSRLRSGRRSTLGHHLSRCDIGRVGQVGQVGLVRASRTEPPESTDLPSLPHPPHLAP